MSTATTAILSAVALAALGSTFYQWNHAQRAEAELAALTLDRESLRAELRAQQQRATRAVQDAVALQDEVAAWKAKAVVPRAATVAPSAPPAPATTFDEVRRSSMNKAILNNLRQVAAARDQFQLEHGRPPASVQELVGETKYIKRLISVDGEDYSALLMGAGQPLLVTTSEGASVTYDPSAPKPPPRVPTPAEQRAAELGNRINAAVNKALVAYRAAHGGANPSGPQALIPYFATPQEGADFVEAIEAQVAAGRGK